MFLSISSLFLRWRARPKSISKFMGEPWPEFLPDSATEIHLIGKHNDILHVVVSIAVTKCSRLSKPKIHSNELWVAEMVRMVKKAVMIVNVTLALS